MKKPDPVFNFRLPKAAARNLRGLAKVYNGGNASAFLRDMVFAALSGPEEVAKFNLRLMEKVTGQMTLQFLQDTSRRRDPVAGTRKRGERRERGRENLRRPRRD
jgi:hypothetical protein